MRCPLLDSSTLVVWSLAVACAPAAPPDAESQDPRPATASFEGVEPSPPGTFQDAKPLALDVYRDNRKTFYCDCDFGADKAVLPDGCGYVPRADGERARRVEWEHVVPAAAFGRGRACWTAEPCFAQDGQRVHGRECCAETDASFRAMEADLQNLVPEIGELNAERAAYPYGEVEGEAREYGLCDFEVDRLRGVVEPRREIRGDIARIYLYMHGVYGPEELPLGDEALAELWAAHEEDPPDAWEKTRNARIGEIQGEVNPLVDPP